MATKQQHSYATGYSSNDSCAGEAYKIVKIVNSTLLQTSDVCCNCIHKQGRLSRKRTFVNITASMLVSLRIPSKSVGACIIDQVGRAWHSQHLSRSDDDLLNYIYGQ